MYSWEIELHGSVYKRLNGLVYVEKKPRFLVHIAHPMESCENAESLSRVLKVRITHGKSQFQTQFNLTMMTKLDWKFLLIKHFYNKFIIN